MQGGERGHGGGPSGGADRGQEGDDNARDERRDESRRARGEDHRSCQGVLAEAQQEPAEAVADEHADRAEGEGLADDGGEHLPPGRADAAHQGQLPGALGDEDREGVGDDHQRDEQGDDAESEHGVLDRRCSGAQLVHLVADLLGAGADLGADRLDRVQLADGGLEGLRVAAVGHDGVIALVPGHGHDRGVGAEGEGLFRGRDGVGPRIDDPDDTETALPAPGAVQDDVVARFETEGGAHDGVDGQLVVGRGRATPGEFRPLGHRRLVLDEELGLRALVQRPGVAGDDGPRSGDAGLSGQILDDLIGDPLRICGVLLLAFVLRGVDGDGGVPDLPSGHVAYGLVE